MKRSFYRRRVRAHEGAVILVMALLLSLLVVLLMSQPAPAEGRPAARPRGGTADVPAAASARARSSRAARAGRAVPPGAATAIPARPAGGSARPATDASITKGHATTLEEITIQGEIDVPQVLFITGRPRPLYDDGLYRLFRPTPEQLLQEVTLPSELFLEHQRTPRAGGKEVVR